MMPNDKGGLNIVPFIDIMLVLLAIVLSISTFIANGQIKVDLPTAKNAVASNDEKHEITISKDMDLTVRCNVSREDFITLMAGVRADTSGFFEENSDIIYDLCEKYEINEIFFCGLIAAESGWNIASNHRRKHR